MYAMHQDWLELNNPAHQNAEKRRQDGSGKYHKKKAQRKNQVEEVAVPQHPNKRDDQIKSRNAFKVESYGNFKRPVTEGTDMHDGVQSLRSVSSLSSPSCPSICSQEASIPHENIDLKIRESLFNKKFEISSLRALKRQVT